MPASLGRFHSDKRKRARLRRLRKGRVRVSKVEDGLFLDLGATALVHKTGCTEAQLKRAELGLYCRAEHKAPRSQGAKEPKQMVGLYPAYSPSRALTRPYGKLFELTQRVILRNREDLRRLAS
jgi:hypothetical protein